MGKNNIEGCLKNRVLDVYECAKEIAYKDGYKDNIKHLKELMNKKPYKTISINDFLREYLWVVYTCGFKADTVKKHWNQIEKMCCGFKISKLKKLSFDDLLEQSPIKNRKKLRAIKQSCGIINDGFINEVHNIQNSEEAKKILRNLPFIGEITVYHIMRNLGIDCFKPDRHIVNIRDELGISGKELFDIILAEYEEEYMGVVDHILWRASATIHAIEPKSSLVNFALNGRDLSEIRQQTTPNPQFLF